MIWIPTPESERYESAYLVLRPRVSARVLEAESTDLTRGAERILSDCDTLPPRPRLPHPRLFCFLTGLLAGTALTLLLLFLLAWGGS